MDLATQVIAPTTVGISGLELAIIIATAGSVGCATFLLIQMIARARMAHAAAQSEVVVTETTSALMMSFLPMARSLGLGVRGLLAGNRQNSFYGFVHQGVSRKLHAAGNPQGINADEYVGFGVIWAIMAGLIGVVVHIMLDLSDTLSIHANFFVWGGFVAVWWHLWLAGKRDKRQRLIRRALPFSLDLLTLSVEAGLDFTSALTRIVKRVGATPLGQEYSLMLHEIQLGKTRTQALRDFADRADVTEVRSVVASLIQAEEMGASLGPVLRIQAAQQRERRSQRAEEQAMKAPVKMLFPLVLFIFPTTLIMIFAPIILSTFG